MQQSSGEIDWYMWPLWIGVWACSAWCVIAMVAGIVHKLRGGRRATMFLLTWVSIAPVFSIGGIIISLVLWGVSRLF